MPSKASEIKPKISDSLLDLGSLVSERVQIQDVHLLQTMAKRGLLREKLPDQLHFSVNVKTQVDESNKTLLVRPLLTLVAKYDDTADGEEALRIEALFLLTYTIKSMEGLSKANFDAFGETNGLYNAWPFWREYVQATTARLGLPSLTIPVLPPATRKAEAIQHNTGHASKSARAKRVKTSSSK